MTRSLAAAAAAALALVLPFGAAAKAKPPFPARLQVVAKEYYYALSRHKLPAGPAIVELVNFGEDAHDLRLERVGGTHIYRTPEVQPGALFDLSLKLVPGKYELWCSIANHRQLGMQATFLVS